MLVVVDLDKVKEAGVKMTKPVSWQDIKKLGDDFAVVAVLSYGDNQRPEHVKTAEMLANIQDGAIWRPIDYLRVAAKDFAGCYVPKAERSSPVSEVHATTVEDVAAFGLNAAEVYAKERRIKLFDSVDAFVPPAAGQAYVAVVEAQGMFFAADVSDAADYAVVHRGHVNGEHYVHCLRDMSIVDMLECCHPASPAPRLPAIAQPAATL